MNLIKCIKLNSHFAIMEGKYVSNSVCFSAVLKLIRDRPLALQKSKASTQGFLKKQIIHFINKSDIV